MKHLSLISDQRLIQDEYIMPAMMPVASTAAPRMNPGLILLHNHTLTVTDGTVIE